MWPCAVAGGIVDGEEHCTGCSISRIGIVWLGRWEDGGCVGWMVGAIYRDDEGGLVVL